MIPGGAKGVVVVGGIAIAYFTAKQLIARVKKNAEKKKEDEQQNLRKKILQKKTNSTLG